MRRASGEVNDWNRTYAVDGQLGLGDAVTVSSFLSKTETPGLDGRDHAFDVQGGWTSREFRGTISYREVGAGEEDLHVIDEHLAVIAPRWEKERV